MKSAEGKRSYYIKTVATVCIKHNERWFLGEPELKWMPRNGIYCERKEKKERTKKKKKSHWNVIKQKAKSTTGSKRV